MAAILSVLCDFDPSSFSLDDAALRNRLKSSLHLNDESRLDALIATYQTTRPRSTPSDIYFAVTTEVDFRMDAIAQAERKVSQRSAPAYMYRFDWPLPIEGGRFKAAHGAEIPFVFDNLDKAPNWGLTRNEILQRLADKVSGAWAAFARTGNPNHASLPYWPVYDPGSRATMLARWRTIRGKQSAWPSVASSRAEFDGSQQQTVN